LLKVVSQDAPSFWGPYCWRQQSIGRNVLWRAKTERRLFRWHCNDIPRFLFIGFALAWQCDQKAAHKTHALSAKSVDRSSFPRLLCIDFATCMVVWKHAALLPHLDHQILID
jgi:hypothetical protein